MCSRVPLVIYSRCHIATRVVVVKLCCYVTLCHACMYCMFVCHTCVFVCHTRVFVCTTAPRVQFTVSFVECHTVLPLVSHSVS